MVLGSWLQARKIGDALSGRKLEEERIIASIEEFEKFVENEIYGFIRVKVCVTERSYESRICIPISFDVHSEKDLEARAHVSDAGQHFFISSEGIECALRYSLYTPPTFLDQFLQEQIIDPVKKAVDSRSGRGCYFKARFQRYVSIFDDQSQKHYIDLFADRGMMQNTQLFWDAFYLAAISYNTIPLLRKLHASHAEIRFWGDPR